jgi:hypothetical protein
MADDDRTSVCASREGRDARYEKKNEIKANLCAVLEQMRGPLPTTSSYWRPFSGIP